AGFSVLEALVAIAILALASAMLMPLLGQRSDSLRLQASARDVVSALRVTRAAAIARNTELALKIDVDRRTFESPAVRLRSFEPDITAHLTFAEPMRETASRG